MRDGDGERTTTTHLERFPCPCEVSRFHPPSSEPPSRLLQWGIDEERSCGRGRVGKWSVCEVEEACRQVEESSVGVVGGGGRGVEIEAVGGRRVRQTTAPEGKVEESLQSRFFIRG